MIPEWKTQKVVWLSWPHNKDSWGGRLEAIQAFYLELIDLIAPFQKVCLVVPQNTSLSIPKNVELVEMPTNDIWIRDYGPFLQRDRRIVAQFNSWGEKFPPWDLDDAFGASLFQKQGGSFEEFSWVLEGGAVEFNGTGKCLVTNKSFLSRNGKSLKNKFLREFKSIFGVSDLLVLPEGLVGDHTDGHIDNCVRFVAENHVLLVMPESSDINFSIMQKNKNLILEAWTEMKISELPSVPYQLEEPKSYANFMFLNGAILLPKFGVAQDEIAKSIMQNLFPNRVILGIDCNLLVQEGGGLHCMSLGEF